MGFREQIFSALCVKPRITAGVILFFGIVSAAGLWSDYHSNSTIFTDGFSSAPIGLIFGLAGVIEPRIVYALLPNRNYPVALRWKLITYFMIAVAVAIAIYIETVVFKDWHSISDVPHVE